GLRALVADTEGLAPGREEELYAERARLRHGADLAVAAASATSALSSDEGVGAADLTAQAERVLASYEELAPELAAAAEALRAAEVTLRDTASDLRAFLESLEADPGRLETVEAELDRIADTKRRHRAQTYEELLIRAEEARRELAAADEGTDPA